MPRSPRAFVVGAIYHIASRGSDHRPLFLFDTDRVAFLERLAAVVERHEIACVAYCLMGNHYHLIIQPRAERVSRALQELNGGYSKHFNRVHGHSAHLFRNRFFGREIGDEAYLLTACRYVAHNPVRAGLCREPAEWPWSSYQATAGLKPTPPFLNDALLRDACGADRAWRQRYRDFVDEPPRSPVDEELQSRHASRLTANGV